MPISFPHASRAGRFTSDPGAYTATIRLHISDKGQDDGDMPLSRASDGHLESPGDQNQDNKLGTVAHTYNPSLGKWMQEDCCTWLSETLKSDVTGEEGLGQDSHSPSAH